MDPSSPQTVMVVRRRRRTRRHQRNRSLRRAALISAGLGILLGFWVSTIPEGFLSYLASFLPNDHNEILRQRAELHLSLPPEFFGPAQSQRDVYPYSLIPGGVRSVKELRDVFDHDPVLAAHYRGFDFKRAHLMRLMEDRTVYVSYRIAGKVYWTTRRVSLRAGELVITDGAMMIRTRCGNQVSLSPRQEVSPRQEPNIALLDRPMRFFDPPSVVPPSPNLFESSLQRPSFPNFVGPQPNFRLLSGPTFGFVYAPNPGVCDGYPPKRKPVLGGPTPGGSAGNRHKRKINPCGSGGNVPGVTPEPASLILFSTGLGGIYFRYRSRRKAVHTSQLAN